MPVLTQGETRPIILKGTVYHALWDGKQQDMTAEQDRITIPKGDYMELQMKADKCR